MARLLSLSSSFFAAAFVIFLVLGLASVGGSAVGGELLTENYCADNTGCPAYSQINGCFTEEENDCEGESCCYCEAVPGANGSKDCACAFDEIYCN